MFNKIITRTKKAILLSAVSVFTLLAAANVYKADTEVSYMLQGASKATMLELVAQVGGEVIHDFSVINAVSVSLTEAQANELNKINPLVRLSANKDSAQVAGFVWPMSQKSGTKKVAGFVWPMSQKSGTKKVTAFV